MTMIFLAQEPIRGGPNEFLTDPLLTVAAVMLVAVCVLLILFSRLISYNLRRKAWKIRRVEAQLRSGMTPDEIREVNARRRHLLRHRKPTPEPSEHDDDEVEIEASIDEEMVEASIDDEMVEASIDDEPDDPDSATTEERDYSM